MFKYRLSAALMASLNCIFSAQGLAQQQPRQYTKDDYARAERFMSYNVRPLSSAGVVNARWLEDGRFWYRSATENGWEFVVVDPATKSKAAAFDHSKVAAALKAASDGKLKSDEHHLGISDLVLSDKDSEALLTPLGSRQFRCDLSGEGVCKEVKSPGAGAPPFFPTKRKRPSSKIGICGFENIATGAEKPLTTDGVKDFGYATDNAGWKQSDNPILVWSPDSKQIATFQQ